MPYGKSGAGYCIMLIKKVERGSEVTTFMKKPSFHPGYTCKLVAKIELSGPGPLVINLLLNTVVHVYCGTQRC